MAAPKLTHAFDLIVYGSGDFGAAPSKYTNTTCGQVNEGTISTADGSLSLKVIGGSDWMRAPPSGSTITIDARVNAVGDDGLNLDLAYMGKIAITPSFLASLTNSSNNANSDEGYYYTLPTISSRSEKLAWVNDACFVGKGIMSLSEGNRVKVHYKIFKVG